ncbi:hypothetical protein Ga0074812_102181 [Parafrankia irregularis]|uniref:Uncharacterized protein n=1 Tax=Parafrankia irregularis TaxID=795642 RepID=A0A0S4QG71_9ACTN|nr:hypothetical protein [Parafrankia irregularis]MBE3203183.1 hypothetical protein [Parafrankia sp. CH37]CUU54175.1 hypothetical protein Ga0074812_102181 [Parafrankia irregularis]
MVRPAGVAALPGEAGLATALAGAGAVGAGIAVLVTGAAFAAIAGPWALAGVVLVAQIALAWAWTGALRASAGTMVVVAGSALACDLAVLWPLGGDNAHGYGAHGYDDNGIGTVAGVVGVSLGVTVLYQLARRLRGGATPAPGVSAAGVPAVGATGTAAAGAVAADRVQRAADRVSGDMTAALGGAGIAAFLTGFLVLRAEAGAEHPADEMVIAGLLGVGAAVLVGRLVTALLAATFARGPGMVPGAVPDPDAVPQTDAVPDSDAVPGLGRARVCAVVGAVSAAAAGTVAGVIFGEFTGLGVATATVLAAAGGVAAACVASAGFGGALTAPRLGPAAGMLLDVLLPLALAAPVVYLLGRQLPG